MTDSPLLAKSKAFALEIIRVCNEIKRSQSESILTNQLVRSGTSIGANIREAFYAHGKADFIAKLQIALKECSESEYWLELLIESGYYGDKSILDQCVEIKAKPHNSARAGGEGFFLSRKFGKQRNTWCISCFPNCADGEKDPPSGRRRNCAVLP